MPAAPSEEYEIVQAVDVDDGATTVLVGEYHDSVLSQRLVRTVLQSITPSAVAVELCPERYTRRSSSVKTSPSHTALESRSVRTVWEHAHGDGLPLYLIDERLSSLPEETHRVRELYDAHNPPRPRSNGDISIEAIRRFRTSVAENHAQYFDTVLNHRERIMAGYLLGVAQRHNGTIMTVVGAAHVESVAKKMRAVRPLDIPNERIVYPRISPV